MHAEVQLSHVARARTMAQLVRTVATKPENLCLISGTHIVEGETDLHTGPYLYILTH